MSQKIGFISTALPLKRTGCLSSPVEKAPIRTCTPRTVVKAQLTETAEKTSWFSKIADHFFGKDICLPQHDTDSMERDEDIRRGQRKYNWRHDACGDASMIDGLPLPDELPRLGWIEGLLFIVIGALKNQRTAARESDDKNIALQCQENRRAIDSIVDSTQKLIKRIATFEANEKDVEQAIRSLGAIVSELTPSDIGNSFEKYRNLYSTLEVDVVCEKNQFLTDEIFAWYRVAGANCMRLKKITDTRFKFPQLTDQVFRSIAGFENDSLKSAADSDRLYYVEYPEFHAIPDTKPGRYVYSPLALFAVPLEKKSIREALLPIAIHCKPGLPMYTPNSDTLAWIGAKSTVQTSDAVTQSVIYHLARCHLLIEVFNCATHRSLAENHPLKKLLIVHFTGTALMNFAATKTLINDGDEIDSITSAPMSALREMAAKNVNNPDIFSFNDWMPDRELENRGVMSDTLIYPYRDDALQVWNAILKWVRSYITAYYPNDMEVIRDAELQKWCFEVHDRQHGNLPGFGDNNTGTIRTVETLVRTVALIIFTASAQHSATNFAQSTVMQYAPAMALGGYTPALDCEKPYKDMEEMVEKVMPPLQAAAKQMFVAEVLGTFHYTRLGDYGNHLKFAPIQVQKALKEFKCDLAAVAVSVGARNCEERKLNLPTYDYLHPTNIPQSINI